MASVSNPPKSGQFPTTPNLVLDESPDQPGPPHPASQLAIRADGALMVSIEDAADAGLDLSGHQTAVFIILTPTETEFARTLLGDAHSEIAARILGRLPR